MKTKINRQNKLYKFRSGAGLFLFLTTLFLAACTPRATTATENPSSPPATEFSPTPFEPAAEETPSSAPTAALTPEPTLTASAAPTAGPTNPLTGLPVQDPQMLERRPVLVKVVNLPRSNRPQWGLSQADLVYEYHSEEGTTRFAAVYYSDNTAQVGPIRSARVFDIELVEMYQSQFVFGSAYVTVLNRIQQKPFRNRLITENQIFQPAIYRTDSNTGYYLMLDLSELDEVLQRNNIDNTRPDLEGMVFHPDPPAGGEPLDQVYVRFSSAIYNRWDYDEQSGKYLRYVDQANAGSAQEESYTQLTDRANDQPISADNVVMVVVRNVEIERNIYEIQLKNRGTAYIARDGQIYEVQWVREADDDMLGLQDLQGNPFPFKPGQTWFEILSDPITLEREENAWRFIFHFPR